MLIGHYGVEVQYFGYVHDKASFYSVLDTMSDIIHELGKYYDSVNAISVDRTEKIPLNDKRHKRINLSASHVEFVKEKGFKSYRIEELLLIYDSDQGIEFYLEDWDKIVIYRGNKKSVDRMRAWLKKSG